MNFNLSTENENAPPQKTNYYGKPIGQPVKVKPNMRIGDILKQKKGVMRD